MKTVGYSKQAHEICNRPYTKYVFYENRVYIAHCKELNGCMSQGETSQEALEMLEDAMLLWLQVMLDDGYPIPEPSGRYLYANVDSQAIYYYSIDDASEG